MATLERIRQRSGLLIVIIGLAMLAFILTDLLGSGNSLFRADANVVGRINGRSIESREFSQLMDEREAAIRQQNPQQAQFITRKQIADGVWNELLREELMTEQYENLGFSISSSELYDRLKSNPSIQSAPAFQDQNTGRFSEGLFRQYINNINDNKDIDPQAAEAYMQWINFEKSQKDNALQLKYFAAVEKGIYVPSAIAKSIYQRNNTMTTAGVLMMDYASVSDSAVEVSEGDLKDYYNENKEDFKTDKSASIVYVNFPIQASDKDRKEIRSELQGYLSGEIITNAAGEADTLESFRTAEDDSLFAMSRTDFKVAPDFYKKENLPSGIDSSIFEQEMGYIAGPYEAEGYFHITKLIDKKELPDSVKARHILISFQGLQGGNQERTAQQAKSLADSLLTVVKEDTSKFAQIARTLSDDPGSGSKGGDLGWFDDRTMVEPFSNFAFRNETGDIALVTSQFGFHIIEILDQEGSTPAVQLLSINRQINPSEATIDSIYNAASMFASSVSADNFTAKAEEMGYTPRPAENLKPFDENISGIGNNREIIRWANGIENEETVVGDIQLFNNGNSSYVVVLLTASNEEGYREFEIVKDQIRPMAIQQKKAGQLKEKLNSAMSGKSKLAEVAEALNVTPADLSVNFSSATLGTYGNEPAVIGVISALEPNTLSNPIEGNRGVYLVEVKQSTPAPELPNYDQQRQTQAQTMRGRVQGQIFLSLKENAKIDDRRAKFY